MNNNIKFIVIVLFSLLIFFIFLKGLEKPNNYLPEENLNKIDTNLTFKKLYDQKEVLLEELINEDSFLIINIWASWCLPCRDEHAYLLKLKNTNVINIIGINYKDKKSNAIEFLSNLGNPYFEVLEDIDGTISNWKDWQKNYSDLRGNKIGVVQGKTEQEIVDCYKYMAQEADVVAISFDYSWYEKCFPAEQNKFFSWMKGRQYLIDLLIDEKLINYDKPHHLLGCGLPQEFAHYKGEKYDFIDSLDTSNPVVHGMAGIEYKENDGVFYLEDKSDTKLFTLMNEDVENLDKVFYNIMKFRANIDDEMGSVVQQLGKRVS